jgi:hypothetical protein
MKVRHIKRAYMARLMHNNKTAWWVAKLIAPALKRLERRNGIK